MSAPLPDSLHDAIALFPAHAAKHLGGGVAVGSIAEVGAFDHERQRVGIALDEVALSGLESLEPVRLDWSGGEEATVTLITNAASLRGVYRVASARVSRPALQLANSDMLGATQQADTELAAWFRDEELHHTDNGRVLNGMYYSHEDTINKLTTGRWKASVGLRNELKSQRTRSTRNAVRESTRAHRDAKLRGESPDHVPPVGENQQVDGGFAVQTQLMFAAKEAAGAQRTDPRNEYAQLINSMKWFGCAVRAVRARHSGPLTPQQILRLVSEMREDEIDCGPKGDGGLHAAEDEDGTPHWPIDREHFLRVYDARVERRLMRAMPPATGAFIDESVRLEIDADLRLAGHRVTIDAIRPRVSMLRVRLSMSDAFAGREALHGRLGAFVAETGFYIDLMRGRIAAALTAPAIRDRFARALQGVVEES